MLTLSERSELRLTKAAPEIVGKAVQPVSVCAAHWRQS
jgi:hypothetical protein